MVSGFRKSDFHKRAKNWMLDNEVAFLETCHHMGVGFRDVPIIGGGNLDCVRTAVNVRATVPFHAGMDSTTKLLS